jgi:hypothetical protein
LKFFGTLALKGELEVSLLAKNNVTKGIKYSLLEGNRETQYAAISATGEIGSIPSGLALLDTAGIFPEFIYFVTREDEARICTFHSLAFLLSNIIKYEICLPI